MAHPRGADLLDPGFKAGLTGATGFLMVGRGIELEHPTGAPDRHIPLFADPFRLL
jgi:hypothetical protein